MAFECKIVADSLAPCGARLTTFVVTYPRAIHSEIMTHRMLTKSSASSRAIPTEKLIQRVMEDPWIPDYIGKNQKGMQAGDELQGQDREIAEYLWREARNNAVRTAETLNKRGVHKQVINRLLEPWMWITVIISGTEWENFFGLRCHEAAEPHFQHLARMMKAEKEASKPKELSAGEWHLPFVFDEDYEAAILRNPQFPMLAMEYLVKVSVGRCARVSYLNHEGKRDLQADAELHDRLMVQRPLHAAPAEHVAMALDWPDWAMASMKEAGIRVTPRVLQDRLLKMNGSRFNLTGLFSTEIAALKDANFALQSVRSGNYLGFKQYRKTFEDENIGGMVP